MEMTRLSAVFLLVLALALVHHANASRSVPSDAGLEDQKHFVTYGGIGSFSGIGSNGIPFGGAAAYGGVTGLDGNGGVGGVVGGIGDLGGPNGGSGLGGGPGGGSGTLPNFP